MAQSNVIKRTDPYEIKAPSRNAPAEESLDDLPEPDALAGADDSAAADELLASMADEAIDRMLAGEADPITGTDGDVPDEAPEVEDSTNSADPLSDEERAALVADEGEAPADESAEPGDDELDALLRGDIDVKPVDLAADATDGHATVAELEDELELDAIDAIEEEPGAIEADAALEARPVTQPVTIESKPDPATAEARVSPWLLPLVWLNAPLNRAPQGIRDAMGKIALVTLLNAAAVFAFVLLRQ